MGVGSIAGELFEGQQRRRREGRRVNITVRTSEEVILLYKYLKLHMHIA